jgi:hypothetical protein
MNEEWNQRLDAALKARGKDWADLIPVTGVSKPGVYGWKPDEKGSKAFMMKGDNAAKVCDFLKISHMWLFFGKGESGLDYEKNNTQTPRLVASEPQASLSFSEQILIDGFRAAGQEVRELWLMQAKSIVDAKKEDKTA